MKINWWRCFCGRDKLFTAELKSDKHREFLSRAAIAACSGAGRWLKYVSCISHRGWRGPALTNKFLSLINLNDSLHLFFQILPINYADLIFFFFIFHIQDFHIFFLFYTKIWMLRLWFFHVFHVLINVSKILQVFFMYNSRSWMISCLS